MRLQFDEIVEHSDADHVLRKLEQHFREVSLETVRTDHQLVVYGLGPSFRTMNPKDKTIVRATAQPAATMLHTEADFLASALMGDVAQDDIVRSKIDRVFESLKAELHSGTSSRGTDSRTLQADETFSEAPADAVVPILANIDEVSPPAPVEVEQISPPPIDPAPDFTKLTFVELTPEPKPEPEPKPDEPVLPAAPRPAPVPSAARVEAALLKKKRSAILLLLPILILLLIAAGFFLQHRRLSQVQSAATPAAPTASPAAEIKAAVPAPPSPSSLAASGQAAPPAMPTDVKAWVQAWAAAMRTSDVQSQLSFYATPLDRYFLAPQVSRAQLLKDKQAEIDNRKGLWTLKAEDVVVDKETATNAVVMLVKHIIVELPSSTIQEQRIKTQLKLKMIDGGWKITSERIIG